MSDVTDHSDLIAKLERNAGFYERESKAIRPADARQLGQSEMQVIGELLREAAEALKPT